LRKFIFGLAMCINLVGAQASFAETVSTADRSGLQAAMFQYIDRQAVEGMFLHMDMRDGSVQGLAPAKAHPMILQMGKNFVLCTDFFNKEGKSVNVDFYVARRGASFVIFHTEVDNRAPLDKLIKDGKVVMVD